MSRIRCRGFHSCQRLRQKQQSISFLLRFFYQEVYARFSLAAHAAGRCPVGRQLRMLALKSPGSVSGAVHADTPSAACPSTQTFPPSPLLLRRSSARAALYLPGRAAGKAGGFTDL